MARGTGAFALLVCGGCAPTTGVVVADPPRHVGFSRLVQEMPLAPGENIRVTALQRGERLSLHLVQIRDREMPHVHTRYDLVVLVVRGKGRLWLGDRWVPMRTGDAAVVPRGTPHCFVNEGRAPAAALVTFAPPFDRPDQQAVPETGDAGSPP